MADPLTDDARTQLATALKTGARVHVRGLAQARPRVFDNTTLDWLAQNADPDLPAPAKAIPSDLAEQLTDPTLPPVFRAIVSKYIDRAKGKP